MDFSLADQADPALPGVDEHATVLTQMEQTAQEIHKSLNAILDYQTHHRLREAQGRKRGEDLNERVLWFSVIETTAILIVSIFTIIAIRRLFSEKMPSQMKYGRM
jgi:p24 family protein gamma-3